MRASVRSAAPVRNRASATPPRRSRPAQTSSGAAPVRHDFAKVRVYPSGPILQRKPVESWGGTFDTEVYKTVHPTATQYGADIRIVFTPKNAASAEKIALVQTAQVTEEDPADPPSSPEKRFQLPSTVRTAADETAFRARMVDVYDATAGGTHIDSGPRSRTPLTGMMDVPKGQSSLAASIEKPDASFGWRSDKKSPKVKPAVLADPQRTGVPSGAEASVTMETAALAVEGEQAGTYYGSVQWGWWKDSSEDKPHIREFQAAPRSSFDKPSSTAKPAPSPTFFEAVAAWNPSKTSTGEASIPLPGFAEKFVNKSAELMDNPDKGKSQAKLPANTPLGVSDEDPAHKGWRRVVVTGGKQIGKVGWVKADALSDQETKAKGK